jgi:hypothetical protein
MSDMFVQVLFVAAIYFMLKWAKRGPSGLSSYLILGALTFCFVYAEWLGVMFALSLSVYAWANRNQPWARGFQLAVTLGACAALGLVIWQYSLISGLHALLVASHHRYLLRSGLGPGENVGQDIHPWALLGWLFLLTYLLVAYTADFLLLGLWAGVGKKFVPAKLEKNMKTAVLCIAVLPPALHHLVFFNFTAYHEYSTLKDAPMIALLAGIFASRLWKKDTVLSFPAMRSRTLVICSAIVFCVIAVREYRMLTGPLLPGYKAIGECIASNATSDEIVFAQFQQPKEVPLPQVVLYAHRNIATWQDDATARELARKNGVSTAVVFVVNSAETEVTEIRRIKF